MIGPNPSFDQRSHLVLPHDGPFEMALKYWEPKYGINEFKSELLTYIRTVWHQNQNLDIEFASTGVINF